MQNQLHITNLHCILAFINIEAHVLANMPRVLPIWRGGLWFTIASRRLAG